LNLHWGWLYWLGISDTERKGVLPMPLVIVKTVEGATAQEKELLIEKMTAVMKDVLGKNPETTQVIIEELPAENWGLRGKSVASIRAGK
jgi:4-oxalocrotonate tautomerase